MAAFLRRACLSLYPTLVCLRFLMVHSWATLTTFKTKFHFNSPAMNSDVSKAFFIVEQNFNSHVNNLLCFLCFFSYHPLVKLIPLIYSKDSFRIKNSFRNCVNSSKLCFDINNLKNEIYQMQL